MNKVISIQDYRLFQTAYDEDEAGTILTVSYDPIGMTVTYIGYILLFMGILWLPFQRQSRIRLLFSKIKSLSMLLLFLPCSVIQAQTDWSRILVQNPNGRIEPLEMPHLSLKSLVRFPTTNYTSRTKGYDFTILTGT